MEKKWGKIVEPSVIASEESIIQEESNYSIDDLKTYYCTHNKAYHALTRVIFKIIILSNKNLLIILAGSMASLPVNILTGGVPSDNPLLFLVMLVLSTIFYAFFLWFVLIANRIKEKSEAYDDSHCDAYLKPKARRNIAFALCKKEIGKLKASFIVASLFLLMTILFLCIFAFNKGGCSNV